MVRLRFFWNKLINNEKRITKKIIEKKKKKIEFSIITNLENGKVCIFEKDKLIDKNFEKYKDEIMSQFLKKLCARQHLSIFFAIYIIIMCNFLT